MRRDAEESLAAVCEDEDDAGSGAATAPETAVEAVFLWRKGFNPDIVHEGAGGCGRGHECERNARRLWKLKSWFGCLVGLRGRRTTEHLVKPLDRQTRSSVCHDGDDYDATTM